eukprot:CAMPEP_0169200864 /NCGR_PEP_ID=MMETSP1016-20121227/10099_1 /TAXON_ID=342587 /ORGANISM="Karlodinium micrum, Strain CCMP2283" /LENGTH=437 /DNA_ID=CAMNT_0009277747 /DNA_START=184 /DNA_END=1494 /DNA_ORIENTATION=-
MAVGRGNCKTANNDTRKASQSCDWPVRCPAEMLKGQLPHLESLTCNQAQEFLCEGQAFVAPAEDLLGTQLLKWDWQYLSMHLPETQKFGVMLDEGSKKIVMSHTARNGERQVGSHKSDTSKERGDAQPLNTSDQTRMTFKEFTKDAERYEETGIGKLPYFGMHVLWRHKPNDNGFLGEIDEEMAEDLWSVRFDIIKEWQAANQLPLVQRFYLFAGVGGTLYHCHYDLQPNIHVQLSGRKRFIIFPPDDWRHLYPFPVHHDLDRRSQVDLDKPDAAKFGNFSGAHGVVVELNPGDALYIPPYWWHHVQSISPRTTSMAIWFFEKFPLSSSTMYGLCERANDLLLMRDIEEFIGKHFADAPGEDDCSKPRPVKAGQVANFMKWLLSRLGLISQNVNENALKELDTAPEQVELKIYQIVQESGSVSSDKETKEKLRELLQ